jgi:trehalose 6-phosphate phosphatase
MIPRPLFERSRSLSASVQRRLLRCSNILLFLDFDGTLAPLQTTPEMAEIPSETNALLQLLSGRSNIMVWLVTGRSEADIRRKVRVRNLGWISNHGFTISAGRSHWIHKAAREQSALLDNIAQRLRRALASVQGVLIENKRYTLTVHYRNARLRSVLLVKETTRRLVCDYGTNVRITTGKKVLEIRPDVEWNKGCAVDRVLKSLRRRKETFVVYAGDDRTDEDAFRRLRGRAVTVRVGGRIPSAAAYRVRDPKQIADFLRTIEAATRKGAAR